MVLRTLSASATKQRRSYLLGASVGVVPKKNRNRPERLIKESVVGQCVGFIALLEKQAIMLEGSQGLPRQPLACFPTPVALELVPTRALSSTEATQ